jgi:hypothetical protein
MVDTLAYGPLYKSMLGAELDGDHWEPLVRERLADAPPHSLDAAMAWHRREAERLGEDTGFWELPHRIGTIFESAPTEVLTELSRRYRTELPDAVLFLDVEPAEALHRSATRTSASSELHEDEAILARLREIYNGALEGLERAFPQLTIHRLDVTGLSLDESLDRVLELLGSSVDLVGVS